MSASPRPKRARPKPAAPSALTPTPELARHHAIEAPEVSSDAKRPYHRVRPRWETDQALSRDDRAAFTRWLSDWLVVDPDRSAGTGLAMRVDGGSDPSSAGDRLMSRMERRVGSRNRIAAVIGALGRFCHWHLVQLAYDASWAEIGSYLNVDGEKARAWALDCVRALTAYYALLDHPKRHAPIQAASVTYGRMPNPT